MELVSPLEMKYCIHMFDNLKDTLTLSAIQGYMGNVWCDELENPKTIRIITADFGFFLGEASLEYIKNLPENYKNEIMVMVPMSEAWSALIEEAYKGNAKKIIRYALLKDQNNFNVDELNKNLSRLPDGYEISEITEEIYTMLQTTPWSSDLCSQFPTYNDFHLKGMGYVIRTKDEIVCGASSYTIYENGIEIEIDTKLEYRRRGLAQVCASKLILECLAKGIYPSWDAANLASLHLSEKLGYILDQKYTAYIVNVQNE